MKNTGVARKIDELGRVVIPIEIRNKFQIEVDLNRGGIRILEKILYSYSFYSKKIDNLTKLIKTFSL